MSIKRFKKFESFNVICVANGIRIAPSNGSTYLEQHVFTDFDHFVEWLREEATDFSEELLPPDNQRVDYSIAGIVDTPVKIPAWRDATTLLPAPQTQVLAVRLATKEQLAIDKECYCQIIFAAIDEDRGVWYDWESDKDINTRHFTIDKWLPVTELLDLIVE